MLAGPVRSTYSLHLIATPARYTWSLHRLSTPPPIWEDKDRDKGAG